MSSPTNRSRSLSIAPFFKTKNTETNVKQSTKIGILFKFNFKSKSEPSNTPVPISSSVSSPVPELDLGSAYFPTHSDK